MAFICKPVGYQVAVQTPNINSSFFEINLVTGNLTTINVDIGIISSAIGYSVIDNLIYGMNDVTADLFSLDEFGIVTNIGPVAGIPVISYNVADIDIIGNLYIYQLNTGNFYIIDVDPFSGTFGTLLATIPIVPQDISDWSFNPIDGMLYAIETATVSVIQINPVTGIVTPLATVGMPPAGSAWGASFFDANGFFYVIENDTGNIYRLSNAGLNASAELFSQSIISGKNDGASCILQAIEIDFGDAPDIGIGTGPGNYNTLLASNGPRHQILNLLFLGTQVTAELDAYQNPTATGDDIGAGIQDDGVTLPLTPVLTTDITYAINMQVTNETGSVAFLYVWIDFNGDGIFAGEEAAVLILVPSLVGLQNFVVNFNLPFIPTPGTSFVRARVTTDNLINNNADPGLEDTRSIGPASDGEVEDYIIEIIGVDLGDAPDIAPGTGTGNYKTLLSSNGPRHQIVNLLFLGAQITAEADAYQNATATGDDIGAGIQDDGVILPLTPVLTTDVIYAINMQVTNETGSNANLYVWIDFNGNGVFQGEEAIAPIVIPSVLGLQNVVANFTLPFMPTPGISFVRARLTTDNLININADPTLEDTRSFGEASDGEVEDYLIEIFGVDLGDAPDIAPGTGPGNYNTLLASNGPKHQITNELFLGTQVTAEVDAYQNTTATGDDIGAGIQDDGVILPLAPVLTTDVTFAINMQVTNNTGSNANLYVWIDFNGDGIFAGEEAAVPIVVPSIIGLQNVVANFNLPFKPTSGFSFVRARLTTDNLVNNNADPSLEDTRSLGFASDGEVEDYLIEIIGVDLGDAPDIAHGTGAGNYNTLLASNGPRHQIINSLFLGTQKTAEADAYQNATATGDDIGAGFQDDGVTLPLTPILTTDVAYAINMQVTNDTGSIGFLYVWIDFDGNGVFQGEEATEPIVIPSVIGLQNVVVNFNLPFIPTPGISFVRARLTTDILINTNADPGLEDTRSLGEASDGEVEDYMIEILGVDLGDAPDTSPGTGAGNYNTLLASNGARHQITNELYLGTQITAEADAYQNATATGDDIGAGVQDDGVTLPLTPVLTTDATYTINMQVTNNVGTNANLYVWIDFNGDGIFAGEEASVPIIIPSAVGLQNVVVNFNLPFMPTPGISFVRARLTTDHLINTNADLALEDTRSLGSASDGEVEDYRIEIFGIDLGDAPDIAPGTGTGNYNTLLASNGPRHQIINELFLGTQVTAETDAYQNATATGDDIGEGIQDDGVILPLPPVVNPCTTTYIIENMVVTNNTGADANLYAWIDFNRDGVFQGRESAQPIVVPSAPNTQLVNVNFDLPVGTLVSGNSFVRVRLTTDTLINLNIDPDLEDTRSLGLAVDGEVEDYSIEIIVLSDLISPTKTANVTIAIIGDIVKYTIVIPNDSSYDATNLVFRDPLPVGLCFITESFTVNGCFVNNPNLVLGVSLGDLPSGEVIIVAFCAKVSEATSLCGETLSNQAFITLDFPEFIDVCEDRSVTIPTTVFDIMVECVSIQVLKEADKTFMIEGDIVTYTMTITNTGSISFNNVDLMDKISECARFIPNSVKLNGINNPGLNPEIGLPIGALDPGESESVSFLVELCEICCPAKLSNRAHVCYRYTIDNNSIIGNQESNLVIVNTGTMSCKHLIIEEFLEIPCNQPAMEELLNTLIEISIVNTKVIQTQKYRCNKLIVEGVLNMKMEYIALLPNQSIYSVEYSIPFRTTMVLPEVYGLENIEVEAFIDDVFIKMIDKRTIFSKVSFRLLAMQGK